MANQAREFTRFFQISSLYKTPQSEKDQDTYGNGRFRNVLPHGGSFGAFTHVIPVRVSVPQLFFNVNRYRNSAIRWYMEEGSESVIEPFVRAGASDPAEDGRDPYHYILTWPENNYTAEEFAQYFDANIYRQHFSYDQGARQFAVRTTRFHSGTFYLLAPIDFWNQVGFAENQLEKYLRSDSSDSRSTLFQSDAFKIINDTVNARATDLPSHINNTFRGDLIDELYYLKIPNPAQTTPAPIVTVPGNHLPNFGGDQNILIKASNLAHKAFLSARAGASSHDVLAVVPIRNQPFGSTLELEVPNAPLYTILNALGFGKAANDLSSSDSDIINENTITICDMKNRILYIPPNHHVHITVKLMHKRHTGL